MHHIEPFYLWRDIYNSEHDENALNYGVEYSEFHFTNRIYNYLIHPQWDSFGSETLFYKQLYVDYEASFCIIEFIGEWNDCLYNDIMILKTELIESLLDAGISNYILIMENVLNFHADSDDYYEEWNSEISGDIYMVNALPHVLEECINYNISSSVKLGGNLQDVNWRSLKPDQILEHIEKKCLQDY